jgi:Tetratricopeptide repeat
LLAPLLPVTGESNLRYARGKMRIEKILRAFATAGCFACLALPRAASAQDTGATKATAAREHFERARMYYGHGAYREAITELEEAHALDPTAKDLVFDLGVVHEKLADIDEALAWFRLFMTMDLTPQERERVDAYAKRLEGAKKELDSPIPSKTSPHDRPLVPEGAPFLPAAGEASRVRMDGLTVGALSVSGAGLVLGIVMGLKAEADAPAKSYVTGVNGSFNDFQERHTNALRDAVIADVGFGVAIAGAVTGAYLYFLRPRSTRPQTPGIAAASVAPLPSGGVLLMQGRF